MMYLNRGRCFRSEVIIYNFDYAVLHHVHLHAPLQQPTDAHYAAMCGAVGDTSVPVEPYRIDICGHFPSITDGNVQLLMRTIGVYYSARRTSTLAARKCLTKANVRLAQESCFSFSEPYVAVPLRAKHYATVSGSTMTRIEFIITSASSVVLGSNIEPFASLTDILSSIPHRQYQQCTPYTPLEVLLPLNVCIPLNEISSWLDLITKAVTFATGQTDVHIMLKGVREGVTTTGYVDEHVGSRVNVHRCLLLVNQRIPPIS